MPPGQLPVFAECIERSLHALQSGHENALRVLPGEHLHRQLAGSSSRKRNVTGILPFHESCMVAFTDSASDKAAFNRAAVYENELLRSGLPAETCLTDKATDPNLGRTNARYLDQALQ